MIAPEQQMTNFHKFGGKNQKYLENSEINNNITSSMITQPSWSKRDISSDEDSMTSTILTHSITSPTDRTLTSSTQSATFIDIERTSPNRDYFETNFASNFEDKVCPVQVPLTSAMLEGQTEPHRDICYECNTVITVNNYLS